MPAVDHLKIINCCSRTIVFLYLTLGDGGGVKSKETLRTMVYEQRLFLLLAESRSVLFSFITIFSFIQNSS